MAKYTPSKSARKSYDKWSNGYYGDYTNRKYGNSSFWMDDDIVGSFSEGATVDTVKLMSYQRAIGNFVRILTKRDDIKVNFHTKGRSYTDGKTVTISSKVDTGDFDTTVGLALHEASHCILTNFQAVPQYLNAHKEIPYQDWQFFKGLVNTIEDRRIDYYVMKNAPGYYGYYTSLYDTYFNSKEIDKALESDVWCDETKDHYDAHITNFANPKRNLNALKNLRKIWNVIDLKNIARLKSTDDVCEIAHKVYNLIIEAVTPTTATPNPTGNNTQPQPESMTEEEIEKMLQDIENGAEVNESEDEGSDNGAGSMEAPEGMQGDEQGDDQDGSGMDTDANIGDNATAKKTKSADNMSDAQKARLKKAIQKQKDFRDGEVKKKAMAQKDADKINELADQDVELVEVNTGAGSICDVIVLRGMSDAICNSDVVGSQYCNSSWRRKEYDEAIEEGWALGGMLGRKLKTRDEERQLKTTRLPAGRIDRRLVAELGFGNDKVFAQTLIKTVKPSMIHISLDASGSMGGKKWAAAIKTATALARACSMIENLRCVIDVRGQAGGGRGNNRALVWVVYDSKRDPLSVVRTKFNNLYPGGSTPEGLCYDAIMKTIINNSKGTESFFVNVSDGEPAFSNYYGDTAESHTKKQIKKIQENSIRTISYFASDYDKHRAMNSSSWKSFKNMYGKGAECIDLNDFNQLSKTLNAMFERDVTAE
jgi:hypothetical protein